MINAHMDDQGAMHLNFSEQGVEEIYPAEMINPLTVQRDIDFYLNMSSEDANKLEQLLDKVAVEVLDWLKKEKDND